MQYTVLTPARLPHSPPHPQPLQLGFNAWFAYCISLCNPPDAYGVTIRACFIWSTCRPDENCIPPLYCSSSSSSSSSLITTDTISSKKSKNTMPSHVDNQCTLGNPSTPHPVINAPCLETHRLRLLEQPVPETSQAGCKAHAQNLVKHFTGLYTANC